MNETLKLIDQRMSLRRYAPRAIQPEDMDALLESAMRAPTAMNMMLYSIVEVADQAKKDRLAETCGHDFIAKAPLVLLFLADMQRWYDYYETSGVPAYCEREGIDFVPPRGANLMMSCCDALIAAQNTVIAAESLGIGSCYIGDIMGHAEEHRALFDLPRWAFPITLVCYGYYPEDLERRRTSRFDRRFLCFKDSYRRLEEPEFAEMLSEIQAKFADSLRKQNRSLAEQTYRSFTLGAPQVEETRSVEILLHDWRG